MNTISAIPALQGRPPVSPQAAVARFLADMQAAAAAGFPAWAEILAAAIEECRPDYDLRRAVLEMHPLEDYYLAGVVALEAAKVRRFFALPQAGEILSLIAEQVDAHARRKDRLVSDLVFFLIGRIDRTAGNGVKLPHDQVVRGLLERLGIDKHAPTVHLMRDILFRHTLAEPLALGVPHWWSAFRRKYVLADELPRGAAEPL